MPGQSDEIDKGGTLRLGAYPCDDSARIRTMERCYGALEISERHRHRYEFNNDYRRGSYSTRGSRSRGLSPDGRLVETVELSRPPVLSSACSTIRSSNRAPTRRIPCSKALLRPLSRRRQSDNTD